MWTTLALAAALGAAPAQAGELTLSRVRSTHGVMGPTRAEDKRETFVAHVVFVLKDQVDNARIPINPLGLTIAYFREDQAFVNDRTGPSAVRDHQ